MKDMIIHGTFLDFQALMDGIGHNGLFGMIYWPIHNKHGMGFCEN